ncbi:hypothetical protein RRF57_000340 [Xylaria bambusicola]|uniref:Uncharacterized protein n=1 Tax=Xylaria bambusicola TaxID=326684 RepID=A0AAN7Z2F4_9PEZI
MSPGCNPAQLVRGDFEVSERIKCLIGGVHPARKVKQYRTYCDSLLGRHLKAEGLGGLWSYHVFVVGDEIVIPLICVNTIVRRIGVMAKTRTSSV